LLVLTIHCVITTRIRFLSWLLPLRRNDPRHSHCSSRILSSRQYSSMVASRQQDTDTNNGPCLEETVVGRFSLPNCLDILRSEDIKMPASVEELDKMSWKRFLRTSSGWSGALSTYRPRHHVNLDQVEEGDPRVLNRPKFKMLEITDAALFCKAPNNEPPDMDTEESQSIAFRSHLQPNEEFTSGSTPRPELDIAMIRAMLGSVEMLSFRPTERLERHINEMFTNLKIPLHITKLILPEEVLLYSAPEDQIRNQLSERITPIINHIYAAAGFPFRWFSNDDPELLAALSDIRDVDGQLVSPIWSKADCMLVKIDPATEKINRLVEIPVFIMLKSSENLNLAGQAINVMRPRENTSYAKALIAQMGADFWFTGARLGCFWDGHFMAIAQTVENGQKLDIHFSRVVAAGSLLTHHKPWQKEIAAKALHSLTADHLRKAKGLWKAKKRKLRDTKAAEKAALAAMKKAESIMEEAEEALRCAKERGNGDTAMAENTAEECKKEYMTNSAAAAKMAIEAKIAQEKCEETKAAIDDLQDGRCYISDIYRGLNSYGLVASIGLSAVHDFPPHHARRKPTIFLAVHPFDRASARESDEVKAETEGESMVALDQENGGLHDSELPLPYIACGRNIIGGGLHGIVCDGTFHDLDGITTSAVVKMPRLTRYEADLTRTAEAMEHELQVYKALHRIQGSVIPRLYGYAYIYDWYSGQSIPALVLENAGANNLASLDTVSTMTDDEKSDIKNVLVAFHNEGWIHGDIAGRNILYSTDTDGRKNFRLCDLSLAAQVHCDDDKRGDVVDLVRMLYLYEDDEDEDDDDE
ncbi:hypothetical protein F5146DRAFT_1161857, partial [Armillaria mellea]